MILVVCAITVLSLLDAGACLPQTCEDLIRPLVGTDVGHVEGTWALVAGSLNRSVDESVLKQRDSITFHGFNSTYVQANRFGDECRSYPLNATSEGHVMTLKGKHYVFTATFLITSCPDCVLFRFDVDALSHTTTDLYLLSKRRKLNPTEEEEFASQVKCLKLPQPVWMDPSKELCPLQ